MTVPRLVALDVDGTLADPEGVIRPRTLEAVAAVRAAGAEVVVATGRPWRIAERTIGEIGGAGWAVCSNGSMALRLGGEHEVIRNIFLPDDMPGPVVARLREALPGIRFAFEFEFGAKSEPGWQERLPPGVPIGRYVDDILTLLHGDRGPVRKVIAFHDDYDHRIAELAALLSEHAGDGYHVGASGLPFAEVGMPGINKAVALADICERLAIDQADVLAFGDEMNDAEMLAWAGTGVAMGNATEPALAVADLVAPSNADDGVAHHLEQLLAP